MAGLVVATVITAGAMGAGGLVYYLVRRDHEVCPRCGRGWGRGGERALVRMGATAPAETAFAASPNSWLEEGRGRPLSVMLAILAAILTVIGIVEFEMVPLLLGLAAGGGSYVFHRAATRAREERRAALISSLQLPVLKLAAERGGRLTVSEVSASLGWTLPRAEKVLISLDDGIRVDSEVTDEGLIVYQFRELRA